MPAIPTYLRDPYQTELDVEVLRLDAEGGRSYALLSDTVLYPEGGGQPADHGHLGEVAVTDVQKSSEGIRHYVDGELVPGTAPLRLDWGRRFDHMQQHTAQHLLTAVAADRFGWPTTSFHLGVAVCDIEIEAKKLSEDELHQLEDAVATEIRANRPISSRFVASEELPGLEVRSRGLPPGHQGDVRLVAIEGVDLAACGGTHLRSTGEIEALKLLGTESLRGGVRLTWVAGARLRARLGAREQLASDLRGVFGAADDELLGIARGKLDQLKQLGRQHRKTLGELARLTAAELAREQGPLVERHFDDVDLGFLGQVARAVCPEDSDQVLFLTAQDGRGAYLLVAAGGRAELDVQAAGKRAAAQLEGRGGGSGRIFQGRVGSLAKRQEALDSLDD